jgi:hypothetical protein
LITRLLYTGCIALLASQIAIPVGADDPAGSSPDDSGTTYQSGYGSVPGFGGPSSVSEQLRESNETRQSMYQFDTLQRIGEPWFDWKRRINEDHGFSIGANAYWLYQGSRGSIGGEDDAFGGI